MCSTDTACTSGHCVDGVCCSTTCDGTCEACSAAKTGGADGTCAPVTAATDPDNECAAACSDGAITNMCDGHGACAQTSCGGYACASATECGSACASVSDCTESSFCETTSMTCVKRLRVALVAGAGSCLDQLTNVYPQAAGLLAARGHRPELVLDTDIATADKIKQYDVIITGGPGNSCGKANWATFDSVIADYVNNGGGVVAAGWTLYNIGTQAPNFSSIMPNSGNLYNGAAQTTITPVGGDPISMGLGAFNAPEFVPYGSTSPKAGATIIATAGGIPVGESWSVGNGRTVFLAPLYFEDFPTYQNQELTDGTQPNAVELLMRAVEWAGKER